MIKKIIKPHHTSENIDIHVVMSILHKYISMNYFSLFGLSVFQ